MDKKVVLVGRGPSAQWVAAEDDSVVVALNNSTVYCESVDFLFIHDLEAMESLTPDEIAKVDTLVLPGHPWLNERQYPDFTYADFLRAAPGFKKFALYEGRLENPDVEPFSWLDRFPDCYSSGDAAVAWLLHQGYRDFTFVGIDPGGGHAQPLLRLASELRQEHKVSAQCPECNAGVQLEFSVKHLSEIENRPSWYRHQYESLIEKIRAAGGVYGHREPARTRAQHPDSPGPNSPGLAAI